MLSLKLPNPFKPKGARCYAAATCSFGFLSQVLNLDAITRALRRCGRYMAVQEGMSIHAQITKRGLCDDILIANHLIMMYADLEFLDCAQSVFAEMPYRNVVSWTTLISVETRAGNPDLAIGTFVRMRNNGSEEPNSYTYSAALKACAMIENLELGKWIHKQVSETSLWQTDVALVNAVLHMYVKCGNLSEARRVFDDCSMANSTSWNTMIAGYFREGNALDAEILFRKFPKPDAISYNIMVAGFAEMASPKALEYVYLMQSKGFKFDHYTLPCALKTCGNLKFDKMGEQIHSYIIKCGSHLSCFVSSSLIDMYSNCGYTDNAMKLYDECLNAKRVVSSRLSLLNSMVSGLVINGYNRHALDLISDIHNSGTQLDRFTFSSTLRLCSNLQSMRIGLQVHGLIVTTGFHGDVIVGSNLVDLYSRCGSLADALRLFHELPQKDIITWTGLISACLRQGMNELAFNLFREVLRLEVEVDHFLLSSIIKVCTVIPWIQGGKQVHAYIIKAGFESERITITSLIDMYSKCGEIDDSFTVFESVSVKDTVCWTGIIAGCGNNGKSTKALDLFQEMIKAGVQPNEITFLAILSACRHAGLVNHACRIFKFMKESYWLELLVEHYHCMIDILCRAGWFEEAKLLVSEMPYDSDEVVHNSFISGCLFHGSGKHEQVDLFQSISCDTLGNASLSQAYANRDVSTNSKDIKSVNIKNIGKSWVRVSSQSYDKSRFVGNPATWYRSFIH